MILLYCRKGLIHLAYVVLLTGCLSCSNAFRSNEQFQSDIPPSNLHVGEKAITSALVNSEIPEGYGTEVVCIVDGEGKADKLLEISASEFLLSHGYKIFTKKQLTPVFRFSLDTLYVNLDIKRSEHEGKVIQRYSEARVSAVFHTSSGNKEVYMGRGTHEDSFPCTMLDTVGHNESFVTFFSANEKITERVKPFLLGIGMSTLLWLLYSYRG